MHILLTNGVSKFNFLNWIRRSFCTVQFISDFFVTLVRKYCLLQKLQSVSQNQWQKKLILGAYLIITDTASVILTDIRLT